MYALFCVISGRMNILFQGQCGFSPNIDTIECLHLKQKSRWAFKHKWPEQMHLSGSVPTVRVRQPVIRQSPGEVKQQSHWFTRCLPPFILHNLTASHHYRAGNNPMCTLRSLVWDVYIELITYSLTLYSIQHFWGPVGLLGLRSSHKVEYWQLLKCLCTCFHFIQC